MKKPAQRRAGESIFVPGDSAGALWFDGVKLEGMKMELNEPRISFRDMPGGRHCTVNLLAPGLMKGGVSISFRDDEKPNETNQSERQRVLNKAKEVLNSALSAL